MHDSGPRKRTGSRLRARRAADIPPPHHRTADDCRGDGSRGRAWGTPGRQGAGRRTADRIGGGMTVATDPLVRTIVRDESLTRGLGDVEARMLVEWVVDWAELLAGAARTDADAAELLARLCRRGKAIGHFVHLWDDPRTRGAAAQLAAVERFAWPLPAARVDPPDLMHDILD